MGHYLIAGVVGFIGWRVAELLLAEGHAVMGVDDLNQTYDVRLKRWRLEQLRPYPEFTFHHLDICDRPMLQRFLPQLGSLDAVINLAARVGVRQSTEDPWAYFETNVTGTLNLLELCRTLGIRKFILASTSSVYGAHNPVPFREDADTSRPVSPYAASKKAAEVLGHTYHCLYGLDVTVFRYFTVYGPAGRPDMSPFRFVQWISEGRPVIVFGNGLQSRDFTFVDDIATGTIAGLMTRGYEIINLGSDRPVELLSTVRLIEQMVGRSAQLEFRPAHPADVPATWADISRAGQQLGWKPGTTIEEGFARLVHWYRANREWASQIET